MRRWPICDSTGHWPMLSAAGELARLLDGIAV
jgi:hypothetical protein